MSPRCLLCVLALPLTSCGLFQKPAYQAQGMASYIADRYNGHNTSSGQVYNPYSYTAAHNSLPFGTHVTVKNLQTGQSVKVTVNDRFPYYPGRVINLSSAAAQSIGIPYQHMALVKVTANNVPAGYQSQGYAHQPKKKRPTQTYGAFNGPAPAYQPGAQPTYQPGAQPTYQPQQPAGSYLPAFNNGAPPAGTGLR